MVLSSSTTHPHLACCSGGTVPRNSLSRLVVATFQLGAPKHFLITEVVAAPLVQFERKENKTRKVIHHIYQSLYIPSLSPYELGATMSWPYGSYEAVNDYRWMTWPDQVIINHHSYTNQNNEYQHQHQHLSGHTNAEQAPGYFAANHYASHRFLHHYPALDSGQHMGGSSFSSASTSPTPSSENHRTYNSAPPAWHSGDPACMIDYQQQSGWSPSPVDGSSRASDTPLLLAHHVAAPLPADGDFTLTLENCKSRADPSHDDDDDENPDLPKPRRQDPRWDGDEYAARWVRGEGIARTGFCGICSTWHKLKDSAYWYHMHYTHGISCATGKFFDPPRAGRRSRSAQGGVPPHVIGYDALCSSCDQWVYVGRLDRWHTPYFRHAYKCQTRPRVSSSSSSSSSSSRSSRGSVHKSSLNRPGNAALRTLRSL